MMKLNFGCGSIQPEGWDNLDDDISFNAQYKNLFELPENSYDMIVAHCSLQMIEYQNMPIFLTRFRSLLKPGGVLRISLPNIEEGFRQLQEGNIAWFPNGEADINERFSAWLTWYSTSKTLLTPRALKAKLLEAGFSQVSDQLDFQKSQFMSIHSMTNESITELDSREGEVYFMEGLK